MPEIKFSAMVAKIANDSFSNGIRIFLAITDGFPCLCSPVLCKNFLRIPNFPKHPYKNNFERTFLVD